MAKEFSEEETQAWLATLPKKAVASKVIIKSAAGKILLLKSTYKPVWQFPGGAADARESPEAAAVREMREETGLTLDPANLQVVGTVFLPRHDTLIVVYEYSAVVDEASPLTLPPDEIEGYQFAPIDTVGSMLGRNYHTFWETYRNRQ